MVFQYQQDAKLAVYCTGANKVTSLWYYDAIKVLSEPGTLLLYGGDNGTQYTCAIFMLFRSKG